MKPNSDEHQDVLMATNFQLGDGRYGTTAPQIDLRFETETLITLIKWPDREITSINAINHWGGASSEQASDELFWLTQEGGDV